MPRAERLNADNDDLRSDGSDSSQEIFTLQRRNEHLQRDLNAKDQTIGVLRMRIEEMERQMKVARDQLLAEVKKLGALTSGKLELRPSEELDEMEAGELLEYAQEVASDIDVRRQTLDEGLKGVSTLQENYEESRQLYEQQQQELEDQLEKMASDLEEYQQKMAATEAQAESAAEAAREAKDAGKQLKPRLQAMCGNRPLQASISPRNRWPRSPTCWLKASISAANRPAVTPTWARKSSVSLRNCRPRSANCAPIPSASARN